MIAASPLSPRGKLLLRNLASNSAVVFLSRGAAFLLMPFVLGHLGPHTFGLWTVAGSMVAYGSLLEFGVSGALIKQVAEHRAIGAFDAARETVATALRLYTVVGLAAIALMAAIAPAIPGWFNVPPNDRAMAVRLVLVMGIGMGISIPAMTAQSVLRGLQRFDVANLIDGIGLLLSVAATVIVLSMGFGVLGMATVNIAVTLAMQVPALAAVKRVEPQLYVSWRGASLRSLRRILSFSTSLFVLQVAGRLQTKTDEIVIAILLPLTAVTPYAVARRLSELAQMVANQLVKLLLPLSSELQASNEWDRMRSIYIASSRLTLAICCPICVIVVLLAGPLLNVWIGPGYAQYSTVVVILALASLASTSQWPIGSILQGIGKHRPLAIAAAISGVTNLALSILLLPRLGLAGVALGTLIPTVVENLGFVLPYSMRLLGVSAGTLARQVVTPILIALFPMVIVMYGLREIIEPVSFAAVIFVAACGLGVFLIGYLASRATDLERRTCRSLAVSTMQLAEARLRRL